ncbi:MAG: ABC transporter ATP-binding protein [Synechococcus sp.]
MTIRASYWKLWPYFKAQSPLFIRGISCTLGYVLFTLALPYTTGKIAVFLGAGNVDELIKWLGLATFIFLVRSVFMYFEKTQTIVGSLNMMYNLRSNVYRHLHRLGLDYFETTKTGDLTYRLTEDIDRIGEAIGKLSQQFLSCVLQLVAIPIYMLYLNWPLTLASLILAPSMAWIIGVVGQRLLNLSRNSQMQVSNLSAMLSEVLSSIRIVKAFAAQDYEVSKFEAQAERDRQAKYRAEQLKAIQFPAIGFLEAVSIVLLFLIGGWQISIGNLQPQEFISYITAVALLLHPIDLVTNQYNEFKQAEASIERIFELMAVAPTVTEKADAISLPPITGKVEYSNVSFAYHPGQPVLQDINVLVEPGEVIALVGPSGAGKTTLVNLLARFYEPQAGHILVDGTDIRDVTITSLRQQIGIVPQDTALFSGTIANNIAYGQTDLDRGAIETAAKVGNAHSFIEQQDGGYDAWVGERGVNLSGGQRQRIAIARAILLDPRVLILDEATSALDSESEALVQEALDRVMRDRTVFIIAHRLSTVRKADRILFLEKGRILESGTHTELLEKQGRYAQFYNKQFRGE